MKKTTFITIAILATSFNASAAVISVNFQGGLNGAAPTGTPVTSTAGFVPASNWTNATGGSGTASNLVDSTGAPTSTVVTWGTNNLWDLANGDGNGGDQDMMSGYLDNFDLGSSAITISGLPANSGYEVYVYFNRGALSYTGLTANDGSGSGDVSFYAQDNGSSYATNGYILSTDTTVDNTDASFTTGNMFNFSGFNGSAFTITSADNPNNPGTWKAYVQGIQIVTTPVPEPSSTALIGLGICSLILRRRR